MVAKNLKQLGFRFSQKVIQKPGFFYLALFQDHHRSAEGLCLQIAAVVTARAAAADVIGSFVIDLEQLFLG